MLAKPGVPAPGVGVGQRERRTEGRRGTRAGPLATSPHPRELPGGVETQGTDRPPRDSLHRPTSSLHLGFGNNSKVTRTVGHFASSANSQNDHAEYEDRTNRKRDTTNTSAETPETVQERRGRGLCTLPLDPSRTLGVPRLVTGDRCRGVTRVPVTHQGNTRPWPCCNLVSFLEHKGDWKATLSSRHPHIKKGPAPSPKYHSHTQCPSLETDPWSPTAVPLPLSQGRATSDAVVRATPHTWGTRLAPSTSRH